MSDIPMPGSVEPVPSLAGRTAAPVHDRPAAQVLTDWARKNLFGGWASTAVTLLFGFLMLRWAFGLFDWGVLRAIWEVPRDASGRPDAAACRALHGAGACWAVIADKHRFILFGPYLYDQQWRPLVCIFLFVGLYVVSVMRRFWRPLLGLVWLGTLAAIFLLMWGGVFGMPFVPTDQWGGLPLTLILSTFGIAAAFPLAIVVALGRRARGLPTVRVLCIAYVELIRGVPLISVLFMASVLFPLFMPEGLNPNKLLRAQVAIILFAAAYLAEVIRGGLQALPKGQYEAADALGLSVLAQDRAGGAAAGAAAGDPAAGQHLYRAIQGHLAGADHRHLRPADGRQDGDRRPGLVGLRQRGLLRAGGDLLRLLLRHVALQPRPGTRLLRRPAALTRNCA